MTDDPRSVSIALVTSVPSLSHHPTSANYFTVELTILKEVTRALANLFGLTLPVSLKK